MLRKLVEILSPAKVIINPTTVGNKVANPPIFSKKLPVILTIPANPLVILIIN